jgi:hypothetical protein
LKVYNFEAEILKHDGMDAAYITFPYQVEKEFGVKGQVKVRAIFDETVEYRGSLAKMGLECHCLGLTQKIRKQLGKQAGDVIRVSLHADLEPREIAVPEDLQLALVQNNVESRFLSLSYTNRKRIVTAIESAKKAETRASRLEAALGELKLRP